MARVAVLIDRAPSDPDWKGGVAWTLVNALAESQHDVQVFSPLDPDRLGQPHPRVGLARPAPSFQVGTMITWARALALAQPHVIHTFAPRDPSRWGKLTVWPYLDGLAPALPRAARLATVFEATDVARERAGASWLRGHARWTTFTADVRFKGELDVLSLGDLVPSPSDTGVFEDQSGDEILIPAPVAEWTDLSVAFAALARFLAEDQTRRVRIVGGWGDDVPMSERRRTWTFLADFGARVRMGPPRTLVQYARDRRIARGVWTTPLATNSFRLAVDRALATPGAVSGGTVNHLSRIYSTVGRW